MEEVMESLEGLVEKRIDYHIREEIRCEPEIFYINI